MSVDYKKLDNDTKFKYHNDKLEAAKALGYTYVSEAVIDLYVNKKLSMLKVAKMMDNQATKESIGRWLKIWGVKSRPKGGDTSKWDWPENCLLCGKLTKKGRRTHGMHDSCSDKFRRGTKNWITKYSKSAGGLTRLKADFGIANHVDEKLLISVLNKMGKIRRYTFASTV